MTCPNCKHDPATQVHNAQPDTYVCAECGTLFIVPHRPPDGTLPVRVPIHPGPPTQPGYTVTYQGGNAMGAASAKIQSFIPHGWWTW